MNYKRRAKNLVAAERRLKKYFLNFSARTVTNYTPRQLRQAESYVIHVHSELECYFEDMVRFALDVSESKWKLNKHASTPLIFLTSFYNDRVQQVKNIPTSDIWEERVDSALRIHKARLGSNHGIRPNNIVSLYAPIGFDVRTIDGVLLSELNSFGQLRGGYAHSSLAARAGATFDPFLFAAQASRLFTLIDVFDRDIQRYIASI